MKRVLFAFALLATALHICAHDFEASGIYYTVKSEQNKTCCVSFRGNTYSSFFNEYDGDVVIPEKVTYGGVTYMVVGIDDNAFRECMLRSVTISRNITTIGEGAFYYCTALTRINFDAINVRDLPAENYAFYAAGSTGGGIQLNIGKQVNRIPANLFCPFHSTHYTPNIKEINFAKSSECRSIGEYAFYDTNVKSITFPRALTTIGDCAFYDSNIKEINFNESLSTIGARAFYSNSALTKIVIPDNVVTIGEQAFQRCTAVESLTIGEGVITMGSYAFADMFKLRTVYYNAINANDTDNAEYVLARAGEESDGLNFIISRKVQRVPAYMFNR